MDKTRMMNLAEELLERAKNGKIAWEVGLMRNAFGFSLPNMSIMISREGPLYTLSLLGEDQRIVDRLYSSKAYDPAFRLLQEIYDLARGRTAPRRDDTVDKAVGYLRASQKV